MPTLAETCKPRQSVFDRTRRDTVLNLSDLLQNRFDADSARQFFSENYITAGMKVLIQKSFDRLSGKQEQPSAYLLSQAMGGGKTHSMIALGLLARYPEIRPLINSDFNLGSEAYHVIGFDGRESDYPFGLWGALAEQLGEKEVFSSLYSPLQAPGVTSWVHLLKNKSVVILLDELPPYFNNARSIQIGASNLSEVTATALSNLLVAANREELSRVVIVISDLSSTAYTDGSLFINQALENFRQETQRNVVPIEPVATQGDEIFHILRTRLFETLPDKVVRDAVAVAYAKSVEQAKQMELTAETPASFASQIRESYPFHYALRDLYGRFKANPGFQQTRGLLRLMRAVTADLWESGKAKEIELIHPYDVNLNVQEIFNEFSTINPSLTEAIRVDIANHGTSHAEQLDVKLGGGTRLRMRPNSYL
jgi:predicted AAA+ superfamily ATPase